MKLSQTQLSKIRPGKTASHGKQQTTRKFMNQQQEKLGILKTKERPGEPLGIPRQNRLVAEN